MFNPLKHERMNILPRTVLLPLDHDHNGPSIGRIIKKSLGEFSITRIFRSLGRTDGLVGPQRFDSKGRLSSSIQKCPGSKNFNPPFVKSTRDILPHTTGTLFLSRRELLRTDTLPKYGSLSSITDCTLNSSITLSFLRVFTNSLPGYVQ